MTSVYSLVDKNTAINSAAANKPSIIAIYT
jgi:hypothetical protein